MGAGSFSIFWGLVALLPFVIYIVLLYRGMKPVTTTFIIFCVAAFIARQDLFSIGKALTTTLAGSLAAVIMVIMFGRGLGVILTETKVAHILVRGVIGFIGIKTEKRAIMAIMASCLLICALLGTMSGGIAIMAPVVLPIAAAVGLKKNTLGVIFQGVGEEAMTLGPFTAAVVTLLGVTKISFGDMLLYCAGPIAVVTIVLTWFWALRIQKNPKDQSYYTEIKSQTDFKPTKRENYVTGIFALTFIAAIVYGLMIKGNLSYVLIVIFGLAVLVGVLSGMKLDNIFSQFIEGMKGSLWMLVMILMFGPLVGWVEQAGGFQALVELLSPIIAYGGKAATLILAGLIGAFGISGSVVVEFVTLNTIFKDIIAQQGITMITWTTALIVATRVTNFIYPGSDMFSVMGFAEMDELKPMLQYGYIIAAAQTIFLIGYAIVMA